jgi:hypothetical protein
MRPAELPPDVVVVETTDYSLRHEPPMHCSPAQQMFPQRPQFCESPM